MKYVAKLTPRASEQIQSMEARWQAEFMAGVEELCADPVGRSIRGYLPYSLRFQLFQKRVQVEEEIWELTVYFQYATDEMHVWIMGFTFRPDLTQE